MISLIYLSLFLLGLCWGSFTNVLIDRGQKKKSLWGRSKCDYCNYKLKWFDNIPVFSFIFLQGICRKCKKKLSWQYPTVEILTGLIFVLTFWLLNNSGIIEFEIINLNFLLNLFYYLTVMYLLWVILLWDFKYMIIPDFLVVIGISITVLYKIYETLIEKSFLISFDSVILSALLGGILLGGFFGIMFWFSKGRWIGGGDVKLGFWLGLLIGLKMVYFLILLAYTSGAMVAIFLLLFSKKKMKSEIPFGPFLIISSIVIIFYQDYIFRLWNYLI